MSKIQISLSSSGTKSGNSMFPIKLKKKFMWFFAHNSLPMRRNLTRCTWCWSGIYIPDTRCVQHLLRIADISFQMQICKKNVLVPDGYGRHQEWMVKCQSELETCSKIWKLEKNTQFFGERKRNTQLRVIVFLWRWWSARNRANDGGRMLSAKLEMKLMVQYVTS